MSFYKKMASFDLGTIAIENIFINDFMPYADGLSVKVYLIGLKLSEDPNMAHTTTHQIISDILNVPISDVYRAWDYWEKLGLIEKTENAQDYDVHFISLRQLYIDKNYEKPNRSSDLILKSKRDERYSSLFGELDGVMDFELLPMERLKLIKFLDEHPAPDELVIHAIISKLSTKRRVDNALKLLRTWLENGLKSLEEVAAYEAQFKERFQAYKAVLKALGHPFSNPTAGDIEVINRWLDEYQFELEDILSIITETTKKKRDVTMNYLEAIFKAKFKGESSSPTPRPSKQAPRSRNKFHNFSGNLSRQYSNEEIEKMIKKRRGED